MNFHFSNRESTRIIEMGRQNTPVNIIQRMIKFWILGHCKNCFAILIKLKPHAKCPAHAALIKEIYYFF